MRVLLDSHALLWWLNASPRLSPAADAAIAHPDNEVLVSAASVWEIAIKVHMGKLPGVPVDLLPHLQDQEFEILSITGAVDWGSNPGRKPLLSAQGIDRLETVRPFLVDADSGKAIRITYGGLYESPWNAVGNVSLSHNGDIDGGQSLVVRLNQPVLGAAVGVAMLFSGHLCGGNINGFRGAGPGDAQSLFMSLPATWPDWDLFGS